MTDDSLYDLATHIFPLPRTVQGYAVLDTLNILTDWGLPTTAFVDVPVGTQVYDWTVLPDAENRRSYHPTLDELPAYDGPLTFAEAVIRGESSDEILLSTYTCHPQMANDNVSGMVVTAALGKWLAEKPRRRTYRLLFAPETIGALCFMQKHGIPALKRRTIAGYTINNCGDERAWSFLPSRRGDAIADRAALHVLQNMVRPNGGWISKKGDGIQFWPYITSYPFSDRGSDERQFCAPGVDLPIASVMRSKHGTYPEYHTKKDDLSVISAKGLGDSFRCYQQIIEAIEANRIYRCNTTGEPMLSRYGLYPTENGLPAKAAKQARDLCAYADGETDLIAIADATRHPIAELAAIAEQLHVKGVLA